MTATLTTAGEIMDKTISAWLEQMDDETRRSFTDSVFSVFEATGKASFSSINNDKWQSAGAIIGAIISMPKEKQHETLQLLKQLGQSGGQAVIDYILAWINGISG